MIFCYWKATKQQRTKKLLAFVGFWDQRFIVTMAPDGTTMRNNCTLQYCTVASVMYPRQFHTLLTMGAFCFQRNFVPSRCFVEFANDVSQMTRSWTEFRSSPPLYQWIPSKSERTYPDTKVPRSRCAISFVWILEEKVRGQVFFSQILYCRMNVEFSFSFLLNWVRFHQVDLKSLPNQFRFPPGSHQVDLKFSPNSSCDTAVTDSPYIGASDSNYGM